MAAYPVICKDVENNRDGQVLSETSLEFNENSTVYAAQFHNQYSGYICIDNSDSIIVSATTENILYRIFVPATSYIRIKTINPNSPYGESIVYGQPIISIDEPTPKILKSNLWEGMIWFNPTNNQIKVFLNGIFQSITPDGKGISVEIANHAIKFNQL